MRVGSGDAGFTSLVPELALLIGATVFHLFTTYPIEPGWVVRHRRAQLLPYAAALCLAAFSLSERVSPW